MHLLRLAILLDRTPKGRIKSFARVSPGPLGSAAGGINLRPRQLAVGPPRLLALATRRTSGVDAFDLGPPLQNATSASD